MWIDVLLLARKIKGKKEKRKLERKKISSLTVEEKKKKRTGASRGGQEGIVRGLSRGRGEGEGILPLRQGLRKGEVLTCSYPERKRESSIPPMNLFRRPTPTLI